MGQARAVMITFGREKHLCFEFQTAKRFTVDDPVTVALEIGTKIAGRLFLFAACAFCRTARIRREQEIFLLFQALTYIHTGTPFRPE